MPRYLPPAPSPVPVFATALALALAATVPTAPQTPPDTVLTAVPGLSVVPEAILLPPGVLTFSTGWVTPPGGGTESGSNGSGNQTYRGEVGWGVGTRLTLMLGTGVNDDPTYAPILGEHLSKSWENLVLGARALLLARGAMQVGLQASTELLWISGDPGIFNARSATRSASCRPMRWTCPSPGRREGVGCSR